MEEGCNIGCGCGRKNNTNRAARLKKSQAKALKAARDRKQKSEKKKILSKPPGLLSAVNMGQQKDEICLNCIHSTQTTNEKKRNLKVCHKTNRLLVNLLKDGRFQCPVGKWEKLT